METKELESLNRDELFEELKGKCKSIVKRDLYSVIICILIIPILFFTAQKLGDPKNIIYLMFWITIFAMVDGHCCPIIGLSRILTALTRQNGYCIGSKRNTDTE